MNSVQVKDSLEGNMREVVGSLDLIKINTDRDAFSDEIQKKAAPDMAKLGLEILSCNIQNITDEKGLIRDLGADNTAAIQKNAKITRANADRDVAKAQAEARVKADTIIAERNNELAIKRAELKRLSDIKKAESDAAYKIQQQQVFVLRVKLKLKVLRLNFWQKLKLCKRRLKHTVSMVLLL